MSFKSKFCLGFVAIASLSALHRTAKADSFSIFSVTGVTPVIVSGTGLVDSTLGGQLTLDTTSGNFTASTLTAGAPIGNTFSTIGSQFQGLGFYVLPLSDGSGDTFNFQIPDVSINLYVGGAIAGTFSGSAGTSPGVSATLTPSALPEPTSIATLGIVGVGMLRRRSRA